MLRKAFKATSVNNPRTIQEDEFRELLAAVIRDDVLSTNNRARFASNLHARSTSVKRAERLAAPPR